jgi:hypothetical protein
MFNEYMQLQQFQNDARERQEAARREALKAKNTKNKRKRKQQ